MIEPKLKPCPGCGRSFPTNMYMGREYCIRCEDELTQARKGLQGEVVDPGEVLERRMGFSQEARETREAEVRAAEESKAMAEEQAKRDAQERELASRALARRSLLHYVERRIPKYKADWVHEDVARRIEKFVQDVEDGKSPRLILQISPRLGKQLINKTKMFTFNRGWTTHGELQIGDLVADINGEPTKVIGVSPESLGDVEISFDTGESLVCHENHEWIVYQRHKHAWKIMEGGELVTSARGTKRKLHKGEVGTRGSGWLYNVPAPPGVRIKEDVELPMDPYVLGVWLGDGTSCAALITHHPAEREVIDELVLRGYERTSAFHHFQAGSTQTRFGQVAGHSRMNKELRTVGVFGSKHIPEAYFLASDRQRLELLAGLVDTDGTVDKTGRVSFSTSSPELRDGYVKLVQSLGQRPYVYQNEPRLSSSGIQGQKPYWNVTFQPSRADIPTKLARKAIKRVVPARKVSIIGTNRVEPQPGKCIQVESPYGVYLAGETFIPTHNSELASISGPAWIFGRHPDWSIMLTSYSDELPTDFSRSIRDQLKTEEFRVLFPNGAHVSKYDSSAKAWSTEEGGGVRAAGAGGSILGFGAHVAVIDDPIKGAEEADSAMILEKQWDWATSTLYSRLAPGGGILLIQQRWSEDDLVGRFLRRMESEKQEVQELRATVEELRAKPEPSEEDLEAIERYAAEADELEESMDVWDVVKYPALATGDEYLTPNGDIVSLGKDEKPDDGWKLLRKTGESIHPKRYSRSYFLKLKRNNPRRFAAMYQQTPVVDDGDYFNRSDFVRRYRVVEQPKLEFLNVLCAWDLAIGTLQQHDHTVGLCGGMDHQGNLWLLNRKRGRWGDLEVVADMILDMHLKYKAAQTGIERTHLEMALSPILRRKMRERGQYIALAEGSEALKPISDKKVRARQFQALAKAGKVFVPEGDDWDEYIEWLVKFGATKVDDDVDASAWLAIMMNRYELPDDPQGTKTEEEDWYKQFMEDYMSQEEVGAGVKTFMGA